MIQVALLAFIAFVGAGSAIARHLENRKLIKITGPIIESQEKAMADIVRDILVVKNLAVNSNTLLGKLLSDTEEIPVEASRVYAALLRQGVTVRLHMLPASSIEEFHDKSQAIVGPGWNADIVEYLDVFPAQEKIVVRAPNKTEQKDMNIEQGLFFLQMVSDRFVKKESERAAIASVIDNYKKDYAIS